MNELKYLFLNTSSITLKNTVHKINHGLFKVSSQETYILYLAQLIVLTTLQKAQEYLDSGFI